MTNDAKNEKPAPLPPMLKPYESSEDPRHHLETLAYQKGEEPHAMPGWPSAGNVRQAENGWLTTTPPESEGGYLKTED